MIKVQELRIGNKVKRVSRHRCEFICYETIGLIKMDDAYYGELPSSYCEPITITEDILLTVGFKPLDSVNFFIPVGAQKIIMRIQSGIPYCEFLGCYIADRIKYLHQLQNAYYVISGRELEFNHINHLSHPQTT